MKKLLLLTALLLLTVWALCEDGRPVYTIDAVYDENAQALSVSMTAEYTNRTGAPLTEVYFTVYANVFRRESTLPYDNATLPEAFPGYYAPSGIAFSRVCFDGRDASYAFRGENECFLRVACDLSAGETGVFSFDYTLLLSENRTFQGCGKDVRLTLFYPCAAVFDGGQWILNAPSRAADFAFSEPSDFLIRLIHPADYEAVSGGKSETLTGAKLNQTVITLTDVPEAAVVLSRRFYTVHGVTPSGMRLTVAGSDKRTIKKTLSREISVLSVYEDFFGPLPYETLSAAYCDSCVSLSRPGILLLGDDLEEDELLLSRLLAEQYFGCAAVTDPAVDPFLRTGLSEYVSLLALEESEGEKEFSAAMTRTILPALRMTVPGSLTADSALTRFTNRADFHCVVTLRGAAVMNEMRHAMGRETFISSVRSFYENGRGRINTIEDFVSALSSPSFEAGPALIAWLYTIDDYVNTTFDIYD